MDDIRRIRRRISRKSRQRSPHRLSRWFTKGVIAVMGLCVGGLSFMIALRLQIPQAQQAMDYFHQPELERLSALCHLVPSG